MQPTRISLLVAVLGTLTYTTFSTPTWAAPKDKQAEKLYSQAMDEDYLNVQFDAAIAKLKKGIAACGKSGCGKDVLAKLYVGLGVIYGGGKNNNAQAKANFEKAFELDPKAKPIEDFMSPELKKIFNEAKGSAKPAAGDDDDDDDDKPPPKGDDDDDDVPAGGGISYSPPGEALINAPLPIYIEFPDDVGAKGASLRYKPFGGTKWLKANMRKMGDGYGTEIPCGDVTTTGELKLYIIASDSAGDPIATAGTRRRPLVIDVKNRLSGDAPAFPGKKPPEQCVTAADCPPDFPGCEPTTGGDRGDKGWGASCEETKECRSGLVCKDGSCEQGEGDDDDDDDDDTPSGPSARTHFISLGGQLDVLFLSSAQDVCGVADSSLSFEAGPDNYFCYHNGTDDLQGEFLGLPADADNTNEVLGGGALAGGRILAGYDYMVWDGGLAVGARIGVAFSTSPGIGDAADRFDECSDINGADNCREPVAKSFLMFHGEVRGSYFIGGDSGFMDGLLRPYAFVGGGIGQVNAGVNVKVCDRVDENGTQATSSDARCRSADGNTIARDDIEAVQVTGLGFVDVGVGSIFAFHPNFGAFLEVKAMFMVPTFGAVLAPTAGPVALF